MLASPLEQARTGTATRTPIRPAPQPPTGLVAAPSAPRPLLPQPQQPATPSVLSRLGAPSPNITPTRSPLESAPTGLPKPPTTSIAPTAPPGGPAPQGQAPQIAPMAPGGAGGASLPRPQLPSPGANVETGVPMPPNIHPPAPQDQPNPGGDFITPFGPGDDLRFQQINPLATERLRQLQSATNTAAGAVGQGPSLSDAAATEFDLLGQQSGEQRTRGLREIGRAGATLGRLGSGMVRTDIGNLEDVLRTREEQARRGLSADVARGESENRRLNLGATAGLEGQVYGQEAGQRGELRGERGYQTDTAQQALDNRIRQRSLEEALLEGQFGREATGAQLGLQGAGLQSQLAAGEQGAAGDMFANIGLQDSLQKYYQNTPGGVTPGVTPPPQGFKWEGGRLVPVTSPPQ